MTTPLETAYRGSGIEGDIPDAFDPATIRSRAFRRRLIGHGVIGWLGAASAAVALFCGFQAYVSEIYSAILYGVTAAGLSISTILFAKGTFAFIRSLSKRYAEMEHDLYWQTEYVDHLKARIREVSNDRHEAINQVFILRALLAGASAEEAGEEFSSADILPFNGKPN